MTCSDIQFPPTTHEELAPRMTGRCLDPLVYMKAIRQHARLAQSGYWVFWDKAQKRTNAAHRHSFEKVFGRIPFNRVVRRGCDMKGCCNPYHYYMCKPTEKVRKRFQARGPKVTRSMALEIQKSEEKSRDLAEKFGVSVRHINLIRSKTRWNFEQAQDLREASVASE